jgi:hypothetical protein
MDHQPNPAAGGRRPRTASSRRMARIRGRFMRHAATVAREVGRSRIPELRTKLCHLCDGGSGCVCLRCTISDVSQYWRHHESSARLPSSLYSCRSRFPEPWFSARVCYTRARRCGKVAACQRVGARKRSFSRTTPLSAEDGPTPILTKSAGVVGGLSCERFILQNDHRCMCSAVRPPLLRDHAIITLLFAHVGRCGWP